jgi:polar amino acid transport system substrate-binding protein
MPIRLAPIAVAAALVTPLAWATPAAAESTTLKAVIFEDVKPLYQKTDAGYEGLGVDVLEQIRMQARRRKVQYTSANSVKEGLNAVITGKADIACGVAFTWARSTQVNYTLPFGIGGTRLLTASDTTVDGTPSSLSGKTVGVVKDSASAKVLKSVVPGVTLKAFDTPALALAAYDSGDVPILGGGTLWLAANSSPASTALLPLRPYGRSGIGCIVNQNNGKLLSNANLAIGQMMQAYMDGDAGTRHMVERWIGPESSVGLSREVIQALYGLILNVTAEISTTVTPAR